MEKILIIEDEMDIAKLLVKRLSMYGYNTVVAIDAYQGIELTRSEKPDLIILDLMLPAGGGLSVLKNIRLSPQVWSIPVIVVTGMTNEEYKKQVMKEGVEAYIEKPFDAGTLVRTIQNILNKDKEGKQT